MAIDWNESFGEPLITELSSIRGEFYIGFTLHRGAYLHANSKIYTSCASDEDEWGSWYQTRAEAQRAVDLFDLNRVCHGIPKIEGAVLTQYGDYCVSFENMMFLHTDGIVRFGTANHQSIYTGYYQTLEEAQSVIDKYNLKMEGSFLETFYVTFTQKQLGDFYIEKPDRIGVRVHAIDREGVKKIMEGIPYHGIYDSFALKILTNPLELDYMIYDFADLMRLKKPPIEPKILCMSKALMNVLNEFDYRLIDAEHYFDNYVEVKANNTFSSSPDKPITIEDSKIVVGKQSLKLGRVIKAIVGDRLDDTSIETIVSKFKTRYEVDTSRVLVSDDIGMVYNISECGGSCMAHQDKEFFEIYEDMGSRIAYILDDEGDLAARVLIHDVVDSETRTIEYTGLDRIFYNDENSKLTIKAWMKEQEGMTRVSYITKEVMGMKPIDDSYTFVPYVDTLKYAVNHNGNYYLANGYSYSTYYDTLTCTSGESDEGRLSQDEDMVYISGDYYSQDDDRLAFDEYEREYAWIDDLNYCESGGYYTSSDSYVYIDEGNYEGSYEPEGEATYCEDISGYVMSNEATFIEDIEEYVWNADEYFMHSDGKWYSEEEEEDTDEDDEKEIA